MALAQRERATIRQVSSCVRPARTAAFKHVVEKRSFMLREPQHERNSLDHFTALSVRPETCMRDVGSRYECSGTMPGTKGIVRRRHSDERQDVCPPGV